MLFVWVPEGSFRLEPGEGQSYTTPPQRFNVSNGYWLGRTEVTRAQFARFVKESGYVTEAEKARNRWTWRDPGFRQRGDHPAVYIGFSDAQRYAEWAGVSLPTEAEWLHGCLAGSEAVYPWGNKMDDRRAWHRENAGDGTRPVGRKLPNAWGLCDMVGNAQEWCRSGAVGVFRGGSWTRCPGYRYLDGRWMEPFTWELARKLHDGSPVLQYPWDDDRGFRCIRRVGPVVGEVTPPPSASH
jgi:formylglycine-generating enzyme required for sulfatase activity